MYTYTLKTKSLKNIVLNIAKERNIRKTTLLKRHHLASYRRNLADVELISVKDKTENFLKAKSL